MVYVDPFGWKKAVRDAIQQVESISGWISALNWLYEGIHVGLDIAGAVPVIGEPADFIHGAGLTSEAICGTREGAALEAGLTFGAMIPVFGEVGKGSKYVIKYGDEAVAAAKQGHVPLIVGG